MLTKRFGKEVCAWGIAIIMGLTTFLFQSGQGKDTVKTGITESTPAPVRPEKDSTPRLDAEAQNAAMLLDNSITE